MSSIFGENLRELRKGASYSQEKLGSAVGVTSQAVSSWERGRTEPNMGQIEMICRTLGCDMSELLKNTYRPITPEDRQLIDAFNDAPLTVQNAIRTLLGLSIEPKQPIKWYEDRRR